MTWGWWRDASVLPQVADSVVPLVALTARRGSVVPRSSPTDAGHVSVKWSVLVGALLSIIGVLATEIWTSNKEAQKASALAIGDRQDKIEKSVLDLHDTVTSIQSTQKERYENLSGQLDRIERRMQDIARTPRGETK